MTDTAEEQLEVESPRRTARARVSVERGQAVAALGRELRTRRSRRRGKWLVVCAIVLAASGGAYAWQERNQPATPPRFATAKVGRPKSNSSTPAQAAAQLNLDRTQQLRAASIASQADLDQMSTALYLASADVLAANAQVENLQAQLASANTTLAYTKIYSPIDGIVIDRQVDPGQTVASSFSVPVLFVIA